MKGGIVRSSCGDMIGYRWAHLGEDGWILNRVSQSSLGRSFSSISKPLVQEVSSRFQNQILSNKWCEAPIRSGRVMKIESSSHWGKSIISFQVISRIDMLGFECQHNCEVSWEIQWQDQSKGGLFWGTLYRNSGYLYGLRNYYVL